jgi:hypothetical protein
MADRSMPIIRMTLEGMQYTIMQCLHEAAAEMDEQIQLAVKEFVTPERIAKIVANTVEVELKAAIDSEIRNFYSCGAGRDTIRRAVLAELEEKATRRTRK